MTNANRLLQFMSSESYPFQVAEIFAVPEDDAYQRTALVNGTSS